MQQRFAILVTHVNFYRGMMLVIYIQEVYISTCDNHLTCSCQSPHGQESSASLVNIGDTRFWALTTTCEDPAAAFPCQGSLQHAGRRRNSLHLT